MEPVKTYDSFLQRLNEKYGTEDRVVCLLILDPTNEDAVGKYIYRRYDYFHARTGEHLDFFCPGFDREAKKRRFDIRAFVEFVQQVEELSDWKYYGGTNLLLLQYSEGELRYDRVYDLNFTRMMIDGYITDYKSFIEGFIRGFKDDIDYYIKKQHLKFQAQNVWEVVSNFLPKYVETTVKHLSTAVKLGEYFNPKNLEKKD